MVELYNKSNSEQRLEHESIIRKREGSFDKVISRDGEEMEHSSGYQLFMKQKESSDYAIKREGYRDDLLDSIYPEERSCVESTIVSLFEQRDIDVLKYMDKLTTVDGLSIVEVLYGGLPKEVVDRPNIATYLFIHTKNRRYLEDIKEYCLDIRPQYREEAFRNLCKLVPDLEVGDIPQLYKISRTTILNENNSELLFWAKALMRNCIKRLGIIDHNEQLGQLWKELGTAIAGGTKEIRAEKLLAFEEKMTSM